MPDYIAWYYGFYVNGDASHEVTGDGVMDQADNDALQNCVSTCVTVSYDQQLYWIHTDPQGTPQGVSDQSNTIVWRATYDPFGAAMVEEDPDGDGTPIAFNLRLPGQYYDAETGLHYNYFRYYDPQTGRYITSDPVGLVGGLNTYAYAKSNPLVFIDQYGLEPEIGLGGFGFAGYTPGGLSGLGGLPPNLTNRVMNAPTQASRNLNRYLGGILELPGVFGAGLAAPGLPSLLPGARSAYGALECEAFAATTRYGDDFLDFVNSLFPGAPTPNWLGVSGAGLNFLFSPEELLR